MKQNQLLIFILTIGVFGILNTEMGVIGLLPALSDYFNVSISRAGWLVSGFALVVAFSGPTMPLLFSRFNRKTVMLIVLGVFVIGNVVAIFTTSFTVALLARVIPAFLHPVYCSLAFTVAAASVKKEDAQKAVAKVFIGVSAGMVVGVPVASFLADTISLQMAMSFFAIVNLITFIATLLFVPSMPAKQGLSYGSQVSVLKKLVTWLSIITVILLNGSVFGVYSYFAEYLKVVTHMSPELISTTLFIYGVANMIGNVWAGRLLSNHANRSVLLLPIALALLYLFFFIFGKQALPMAFITLVWGIIAGVGGNINQYWVLSAAPEAPDFANGLFLTAANLGTTIGAAIGGIFITQWGTEFVVWVGILSLIIGFITIFMRIYLTQPVRQPS